MKHRAISHKGGGCGYAGTFHVRRWGCLLLDASEDHPNRLVAA